MKTIRAKIALYQMGENFDRLLPALSTDGLYEDAEEHIQFHSWANVRIEGNEIVIEIPDFFPEEDEQEMTPPPRYA